MKNSIIKTSSQQVLEYYPDAKSINIGCKKGNYYHIIDNGRILGIGKNKRCAWLSASRNICK